MHMVWEEDKGKKGRRGEGSGIMMWRRETRERKERETKGASQSIEEEVEEEEKKRRRKLKQVEKKRIRL